MAKIPLNNFDKFIREKVEMHQTPVDTDRLWSNIQKTGRSKRTGILPGALLLLLVSFFISVHILNDRNLSTNDNKPGSEQVAASSLTIENKDFLNSYSVSSTSFGKNSESNDPSMAMVGSVEVQRVKNTGTKSKLVSTQLKKSLLDERPYSDSHSSTLVSEIESITPISELPAESIKTANLLLTEDENSELFRNDLSQILNFEEANSAIFNELHSLATMDISEIEAKAFFPDLTFLSQHASRIKPVQSNIGFELRLNGGVGKVFRNMDLLNLEAEQWMQSRVETEHQLEAVRLGIDLKINITNNVYFFAGLEDFRINERFDYSSFETRSYTLESEAGKVVEDENSFSFERGRIDIYEEIHKKGTFYNQLRMINIPIGIGVTQQMGRFSLGLEGGILINAFHQFDGKMADASNALIDMKDAGFRMSQIQTARINGVFSYQLSSRWGLNFITGADLPMRSIQLGQHMSQNYLVFQGNLGICYNW